MVPLTGRELEKNISIAPNFIPLFYDHHKSLPFLGDPLVQGSQAFVHLGSLWGAVQTQMIATPTLKVLVQQVWDEAKNLHFQQFPVMLVPGP